MSIKLVQEPFRFVINKATDFPFIWAMLTSDGYNIIETNDVFTASTGTLVSEGSTYSPDSDGLMSDPDGTGAGTAITIDDVDALSIIGYKWFRRGQIAKVTKSQGIAGQIQISTLSFSLASPDVGSQIILNILFSSWDEKAEYATHNSDFQVNRPFVIDIATGETATSLASKIAEIFSTTGIKEQRAFPLEVSSSGTIVTFTAKDEFTAFTLSVSGALDTIYGGTTTDQVSTLKVVPSIATTQVNFSGRNNYSNLRMIFPETHDKVYPFAKGPEAKQLIIDGDLYSCFLIEELIPPTYGDFYNLGMSASQNTKSEIYINETNCKTQINQLVAFFNSAATTKVNMPASTPAAALATETRGTTLTTLA